MSSHSSRDTFFYLLQFVTLAISATALGNVWFSFINRWTTAPTPYERFQPMDVTGGLSALVIAAPVFLGLSWWMRKSFANGTMEPKGTLRKWLVYFSVFVTALIGIIDLIVTLNTYLNGDFTVRFFFKALTILVIAGSIFGFYLWDIRREQQTASRLTRGAFWATISIVIVTVIVGFVLVGSPKTRRLLQWDQDRVNQVENMVNELNAQHANGIDLPDTAMPPQGYQDPQTLFPYGYRKINADAFEVCANFAKPAEESGVQPPYPKSMSYPPGVPSLDFTALEHHGAGHQCFQYTMKVPNPPQK